MIREWMNEWMNTCIYIAPVKQKSSEAQVKAVKSGINKSDYGGKDLWKGWVLSLEWKVEGVIGDESEGGDCDEVICAGWGELEGEWTEWGWRNEEGSWFHR